MNTMRSFFKISQKRFFYCVVLGCLGAIAILLQWSPLSLEYNPDFGEDLILYIPEGDQLYRNPLEIPDEISMIRLIAVPEAYDGERIRVRGVVYFDVQERNLYLSRDDFENHHTKHALNLVFPMDTSWDEIENLMDYNGRYLVIDGVFLNQSGAFGLYSGVIENIRMISR